MSHSEISTWLQTVRAGGQVRRCHTVKVIQSETVSQHSWGVAMLLLKFYPECSKSLLIAALSHDIPEVFTGDLPAQFKHSNFALKKVLDDYEEDVLKKLNLHTDLTQEEKHWLKACDSLDLFLYTLEEMALGNSNLTVMFEYLIDRLLQDPTPKIIQDFVQPFVIAQTPITYNVH